ncbi:hypothetical protein XENORESO_008670 [Xenotaenia resolanae]|uniref:Secreted protein n=1 Tax=Xenotaenia resolanae TaxID=208358 RepID=A0ABV0W1Y8_9TELE
MKWKKSLTLVHQVFQVFTSCCEIIPPTRLMHRATVSNSSRGRSQKNNYTFIRTVKKRVQPLSRRWVPEPTLCVEASPTISSRYLSTSRTSSGSFPPSEVTFHVPRASLSIWGSGRPILFAPVPHGSPCRWWAHWGMASRLLFGLGPAGSNKEQPSHQALSDESRPQAWLQGETLAPPYRATSRGSI